MKNSNAALCRWMLVCASLISMNCLAGDLNTSFELKVMSTAPEEETEFDDSFDESEWNEMEEMATEEVQVLDEESGTIALNSFNEPAIQSTGFYHRLKPYYSAVGYSLPLRPDSTVQDIAGSEWDIYSELFRQSFLPDFVTFELSVYPMPLLGVMVKDHLPGFYGDFDIGQDFNLFESITAGFEEPYSASVLFSNVSRYRPNQKTSSTAPNVAFMGYLLSGGDNHIYKNELIDDTWYELEWKIKGSVSNGDESFNWGLRTGIKNHMNRDISDSLYVAIERNNIHRGETIWSWLKNTGYEFSYSMNRENLAPLEVSAYFTKYFPRLINSKYVPALSIGIIRQKDRKYSNEFQDKYGDVDLYTLAIRPTLAF